MKKSPPSNRVSPSQMVEWRDGCKRRWWYKRNRPRQGQNAAAAFGDRMHLQLEGWCRDGTPPNLDTAEGNAAMAGLGLLPPPRMGIVETKFEFQHGGVTYNGRVDLTYGYDPRRIIVITDHKSIGNMKRRKKPVDLLDDPQRVVYTHWAAQAYDVPLVIAKWVYYQRRKPKAEATVILGTRDDIAQRFERLHREAGLPILAAKHLTTPDPLPRNLSRCHLYPPEGCPFAHECLKGVNPADLAVAAMKNA